MKTLVYSTIVTRLFIFVVALTAMIQLVACRPTSVEPSKDQPTQVHIAQPQPTVICNDGCPDSVVRNLPYLVPVPFDQE